MLLIQKLIIYMYNDNLPIKNIVECANLTVDEVKYILNKYNEMNKSK